MPMRVSHFTCSHCTCSFGGQRLDITPGVFFRRSSQESGEGSCSIRYSFEAHLHRPGLVNFDAKDDCALTVLGTPQLAGPNVPVKAGPVTQQVKFCYCFNRGRLVSFTSNILSPQDSMTLQFRAPAVRARHLQGDSTWAQNISEISRPVTSECLSGFSIGTVATTCLFGTAAYDIMRFSAPSSAPSRILRTNFPGAIA